MSSKRPLALLTLAAFALPFAADASSDREAGDFDLLVTNTSADNIPGSLTRALDDSFPGDIIRIDDTLAGQSISVGATGPLEFLGGFDIAIEGPAAGCTLLPPAGGRHLIIDDGSCVTLRNLTLQGGDADDGGAVVVLSLIHI